VRHSAGPLIVLHRLPTVLVPILMGLLLVAGLMLPWPVAGLLLLVVGVFLGWLLALSWPIISWPGRIIRGLAVLALLAMTVLRLMGKF
jgi:predicted metal-binding membrane protein